MRTLAAIAIVLLAAASPALAGQLAGTWELTMTMSDEGSGGHVIKVSRCLAAHDIIRIDDESACSVTYKVVSGDTVKWSERCRDGVECKGRLVYGGEAVSGEMTMSVPVNNARPERISQRIEGIRTGRCR